MMLGAGCWVLGTWFATLRPDGRTVSLDIGHCILDIVYWTFYKVLYHLIRLLDNIFDDNKIN
jgi:hypothetical protein